MNQVSDSRLATRKWDIISDQSNTKYSVGNEIIYNEKKVLKSNLWDFSDANVVLVRGDITAGAYPVTHKAIKICVPFTKCITKIDELAINEIEDLDLVVPLHNLLEYIFNYSDTTGSLWFYFKDETTNFNADSTVTDDFKSIQYKAIIYEEIEIRLTEFWKVLRPTCRW